VEGESGQLLGAVVLEYTPLYNEFVQSTSRTSRHLILAAIGSIAIALLLALSVGRSLVRPLRQLTTVAAGLATGQKDLPMPRPRRDEVGELTTAFSNMVQKRQQSEDELRRLRDELEVRVDDRVAELAKSNLAAKGFIEGWDFTQDWERLVIKSRGAHGPATIELFSLRDGLAIEAVQAYEKNLPDWAAPYAD
jgi:HAMP domain-containing protein